MRELHKEATELYKKGDFEGALNKSVDRIKLNYNGFIGEVVDNPEENLLLDCLKKVDHESRAYQRAQYYISHALNTTYPPLAHKAHKIIKKY